jgi:hypothetical protein
MEQDEITRRNVAIAEYMELPGILNPDFKDMLAETLCYNHKWEWIMTAVEKITKESNLGFHFFPPFGRDTFVCRFGTERNYVGDTMIEATWKAVSEYVLALKS